MDHPVYSENVIHMDILIYLRLLSLRLASNVPGFIPKIYYSFPCKIFIVIYTIHRHIIILYNNDYLSDVLI